MIKVVTLKQREEREATRRRTAAEAIVRELQAYARQNAGRFIVYGSVARKQMRASSDIDILIDFPPETDRKAWDFAEDICHRYKMPADIQPKNWASDTFIARVKSDSIVLE